MPFPSLKAKRDSISSNRSPKGPTSPLGSIFGRRASVISNSSAHSTSTIDYTPPSVTTDPFGYLTSLPAIRQRCARVYDLGMQNKLNHFTVDQSKLSDIVDFTVSLFKRDYGTDYAGIPPHGRWRHFDVGGKPRVDALMTGWDKSAVDCIEKGKRLVDLFVVSVLLDAGAGNAWSYKENASGKVFRRSEGLAIASLDMFLKGAFSSDKTGLVQRVDAVGLQNLTVEDVRAGLQVDEKNPLQGLEGRTELLIRLGSVLADPQNAKYFMGKDGISRPGNMLDYLLSHPTARKGDPAPDSKVSTTTIPLPTLWTVIIEGFSGVWPPTRTSLNGKSLGDVWPCDVLGSGQDALVPFHKLSQWLTYSLMEIHEKVVGIRYEGVELMTGLPEYRNGGLLVDTGFLTLKEADKQRGVQNYTENSLKAGQPSVEVVPMFLPSDPVIIEWRAITVIMLDVIADELRRALNVPLTLAQCLEGGTWKAGREIAEVSRPNTRGPPIGIISDGTVF